MPKPKDSIAAVKIYVVRDFDAIDDVLKMIPKPWDEYHYDTCRIASSGNNKFRDGWEIDCWAKLDDGLTKESLEQKLLEALEGKEWIVEDIVRLGTERSIIKQIKSGLSKVFGKKGESKMTSEQAKKIYEAVKEGTRYGPYANVSIASQPDGTESMTIATENEGIIIWSISEDGNYEEIRPLGSA